MTQKFSLNKIVSDMEISRKIYLQYCDLKDAINLEEKKKEEIGICVVETMKKLESVKYHKGNLLKIISDEKENQKTLTPKYNCTHIDLTTGAEKELEAFLMQGKSCLDVLIKIFKPLFEISLITFSEYGKKVVKSLENNLKNEEKELSRGLIEMLKSDEQWLKKWFKDERDTVSHYRSIISSGFVNIKDRDGNFVQKSPKTKEGVPFEKIVDMLYHNILSFCEDFIPLSLSIKFHPGILLKILHEEERDKEFPRKFGLQALNSPG